MLMTPKHSFSRIGGTGTTLWAKMLPRPRLSGAPRVINGDTGQGREGGHENSLGSGGARRPRSIAGMAAVGLPVFHGVVVALALSLNMLCSDYAVVFPRNMPSSVIHPDELPLILSPSYVSSFCTRRHFRVAAMGIVEKENNTKKALVRER